VTAIADAVGVARSNIVREPIARTPRIDADDDAELIKRIRVHTDARPTLGYRRVTTFLNREGKPRVNHKRVYRVMKAAGLLLERHTGKPTRTHDGTVVTMASNMRWCSDSFEIRCWNGERVQVAFAMDCCDREVMAFAATPLAITGEMIRDLMATSVEQRFGAQARCVPHPLQWLSDNGPPYTALETRSFGSDLGLIVCNTPAYSPESNGMAEAFVKTIKRDYVYVNRLESAEAVINQLKHWFEDYNENHPHSGLKMKSPREYRREQSTA
jgi:putative transposase